MANVRTLDGNMARSRYAIPGLAVFAVCVATVLVTCSRSMEPRFMSVAEAREEFVGKPRAEVVAILGEPVEGPSVRAELFSAHDPRRLTVAVTVWHYENFMIGYNAEDIVVWVRPSLSE